MPVVTLTVNIPSGVRFTKSFAGLFGLMAVSDGALSEDDPVAKYVPELKVSGGFGKATFRQVLDMTASVGFSEDCPRTVRGTATPATTAT